MSRWIALAAIALPILVLFGPALFSDRLFAMRDAGHYYYPLFKWCADEWGAGRVPLWNPLENCGTAIHADPTASIWYPGKLVFALPLEFSICFKLYIIGHVALTAVTSYWLARRWGASRYGSALAAISYSCGGSVVFQHCNVVYLVGAAWLPVAVGLIDEIFRERRLQSALWLAVVLALMVLGGDPQMAYHVLLLGGSYTLIGVWVTKKPVDERTSRPAPKAAPSGLALLIAAALIAALLAAVQILPSAEATAKSPRAQFGLPRSLDESIFEFFVSGDFMVEGYFGQPTTGSHEETAYDFSVGPWRLVEFVWPNFGGRMYPTHRRWMSLLPFEERIWTPSLYLGLLPLAFAAGCFSLRSADARIRWLSWLVLLFTLGSFGTFGAGWMVRQIYEQFDNNPGDFYVGDAVGGVYWLFLVLLPKYVLFRYPAKLLVVAALGISQLAAIGWDRASAEQPRRLIWVLGAFGGLSAVAAVLAMLVAQRFVIGAGAIDDVFGPFDNRGAWTDLILSFVQTAIVSMACAWLLSRPSGERQSDDATPLVLRLRATALLSVCAVELTIANHWLVPTAPARLWREPSVIAAAVGNRGVPPRIYREPRGWPDDFTTRSSPQRMAELVKWERQTLAGRYGLLENVSTVNAQTAFQSAAHPRYGLVPDYFIRFDDVEPWFGEPVNMTIDGMPPGVRVWRRTGEVEEGHRNPPSYQPSAFYRGAWISGLSWGALLVVGLWRWRRWVRGTIPSRLQGTTKSNNSAPA